MRVRVYVDVVRDVMKMTCLRRHRKTGEIPDWIYLLFVSCSFRFVEIPFLSYLSFIFVQTHNALATATREVQRQSELIQQLNTLVNGVLEALPEAVCCYFFVIITGKKYYSINY